MTTVFLQRRRSVVPARRFIVWRRRKCSSDDGLPPVTTVFLQRRRFVVPRRRSIVWGRRKCSSDDGLPPVATVFLQRRRSVVPGRRFTVWRRRKCSSGDGPPPAATVFLQRRRSVVPGQFSVVSGDRASPLEDQGIPRISSRISSAAASCSSFTVNGGTICATRPSGPPARTRMPRDQAASIHFLASSAAWN